MSAPASKKRKISIIIRDDESDEFAQNSEQFDLRDVTTERTENATVVNIGRKKQKVANTSLRDELREAIKRRDEAQETLRRLESEKSERLAKEVEQLNDMLKRRGLGGFYPADLIKELNETKSVSRLSDKSLGPNDSSDVYVVIHAPDGDCPGEIYHFFGAFSTNYAANIQAMETWFGVCHSGSDLEVRVPKTGWCFGEDGCLGLWDGAYGDDGEIETNCEVSVIKEKIRTLDDEE
ncbi:hypothetical protein F4778DRAFT_627816 [Xylariomycetidae sp. FL2044]|nr:hypothetical protein F4778DRAFT_627816 [Xylariomycetidae sp. FL2044]